MMVVCFDIILDNEILLLVEVNSIKVPGGGGYFDRGVLISGTQQG